MNLIKKKTKVIASLSGLGIGAMSAIQVAQAEELTRGHIDVYVDHSALDDIVSKAESAGVTVVHEDSEILTGNSEETKSNVEKVKGKYSEKIAEIEAVVSKYKTDMSKYESEVAKNQQAADIANGEIDAYKVNLASNGQTIVSDAMPYSVSALEDAKTRLAASFEKGKKFVEIQREVDAFNTAQNSMTGFQSQMDMGNVKVVRETVTVANKGETEQYLNRIKTQQQQLEQYVASLGNQTGTVDDATKPTYTLYDIQITGDVASAASEAVHVPYFTPVPVVKPATPSVSFKYYDVRSQPEVSNAVHNKDDEEIINAVKASSGGKKVVQALVNQTVGIKGESQPLPSNRFDKIHDITSTIYLPDNVEVDESSLVKDVNWLGTYNKANKTITIKATDRYLVDVNLNQNPNRGGTVGGTVDGEFTYDIPSAFFKLTKDDATYQVRMDVVLNHEYVAETKTITIRTDSATPDKHNYDSKMQIIDGKAVLPGTTNNYIVTWDFDQYKNVNIDKSMQDLGLDIYDVFPDEALSLKGPLQIKDGDDVIATANVNDATSGNFTGSLASGFTWEVLDAVEGIDVPKGHKVLKVRYAGYDQAFYKTYVEGGKQLKVVMPMLTKLIDNTPDKQGGTYGGNTYKNIAYQKDFGNLYKTNEVENTVPTFDPRKDAVLSFSDLTSLDLKANTKAEIEKGTFFQYRAKGSTLPTNIVFEGDMRYEISDTFHDADQYEGNYHVETGQAFIFKPGSALAKRYASTNGVMAANTDITKYTTQIISRNVSKDINTPTGLVSGADTRLTKVNIVFDQDFLNQIDFTKTNFQVDTFLQTKRVKDIDDVVNVFEEHINGISLSSQDVHTNSKPNQAEELERQLKALTSRVETNTEGIETNKQGVATNKTEIAKTNTRVDELREETISALSVVIKSIADNRLASEQRDAAQDVVIAEHDVRISENNLSIKNLTERVAKNEAVTLINVEAIDLLLTHVEATDKHLADVDKAIQQELGTLTIFTPTVLTDQEAFDYAISRGIAPGAIKSITLDERKHFVVTYNMSEGAINSSKKALTEPVNNIEMSKYLTRYMFYTLTTEQEVRDKLFTMGYANEAIISLTNNGHTWEAVVNVKGQQLAEQQPSLSSTTSDSTVAEIIKDSQATKQPDRTVDEQAIIDSNKRNEEVIATLPTEPLANTIVTNELSDTQASRDAEVLVSLDALHFLLTSQEGEGSGKALSLCGCAACMAKRDLV